MMNDATASDQNSAVACLVSSSVRTNQSGLHTFVARARLPTWLQVWRIQHKIFCQKWASVCRARGLQLFSKGSIALPTRYF